MLYPSQIFADVARNVWFNCVSESQVHGFVHLQRMLGVVRNGIELERFPRSSAAFVAKDYLLWLGRICEEKAPHLALDVAEACAFPLVVAGSVYPFSYHQQYFDRELVPRLGRNSQATFIESPTF